MNIEIHKNNRALGLYYHKAPGIYNIKQTRQIALRDIKEDCKKNNTVNYVDDEYKVLEIAKYDFIYIPIEELMV